MIKIFDTLFLWLRAIYSRYTSLGSFTTSGILRQPTPADPPIVYLDLGSYEGKALKHMSCEILPRFGANFQVFAIEANKASAEILRHQYLGDEHVEVVWGCVHETVPDGSVVRLSAPDAQHPASVAIPTGDDIEAPAIKLSSWLSDRGIQLDNCVCILRMGIVGGESGAVKDLVSAGIYDKIDGYYGCWDKLRPIDPVQYTSFRALLKARNIHPFPFSDRDFHSSFRIKCIDYDLATSIYSGIRKLELSTPAIPE